MDATAKVESIFSLFEESARRYNHPKLLNYKEPKGAWRSFSSQETAEKIRFIALGLYSRGVRFGHHVAILSENRPEWVLFDLASLSIGAVNIPIYTTQSLAQIDFILQNSHPHWLAISTFSLYERVLPLLEKLGLAHSAMVFDKASWEMGIVTLEELIILGIKIHQENPSLFAKLNSKVKSADLATIVYTSGETGIPKGVMLTHGNLIFNVTTAASLFNLTPQNEVALSYLPLSHVFERATIYHYLYKQIQIYFAESVEHIAKNLLEVKPTLMTTVPRFLEKAQEQILGQAERLKGARKKIFEWALDLASRFNPEKLPLSHRLKLRLADKLVYRKVRKRFGGRLRLVISGGAKLTLEIAKLFCAMGIPIYQGYGLTETSPVIAVNRPGKNRLGSVGQVVPGVSVKIAPDGEILVQGPNVMKGYYNNEEATRNAFDNNWFKTGDIGHLDSDGYLFVTDRKKDLFKTSGGKYVAPQVIEKLLETNPMIKKALVVGDGRKFASALIFPNFSALKEFAEASKLLWSSETDLVANPMTKVCYQKIVDQVNKQLANWETIKKFVVLADSFPLKPDGAELTPNARRKKLEAQYQADIESLYKHEENHAESH